MIVLKSGLLFSKYNTIENLLLEYYPQKFNVLKPHEQKILVVELCFHCENVFKKFDCTDNFSYDDRLDTELIGTIEEHFEFETSK